MEEKEREIGEIREKAQGKYFWEDYKSVCKTENGGGGERGNFNYVLEQVKFSARE